MRSTPPTSQARRRWPQFIVIEALYNCRDAPALRADDASPAGGLSRPDPSPERRQAIDGSWPLHRAKKHHRVLWQLDGAGTRLDLLMRSENHLVRSIVAER